MKPNNKFTALKLCLFAICLITLFIAVSCYEDIDSTTTGSLLVSLQDDNGLLSPNEKVLIHVVSSSSPNNVNIKQVQHQNNKIHTIDGINYGDYDVYAVSNNYKSNTQRVSLTTKTLSSKATNSDGALSVVLSFTGSRPSVLSQQRMEA